VKQPLIIVKDLCKTYSVSKREKGIKGSLKGLFHREKQIIEALKGISFQVDPGDCIGFIGPNGAGKSTTLKILSGILLPSSGQCSVLGRIPWMERMEHVRHIGVVFGQRTQLWWDLPLQESYYLLKSIYSIPNEVFHKRMRDLVSLLQMEPWLSVPVRQLSLGLRMRADIIASLLHDPEILFLDEPSIGLDTETKIELRRFLKHLNEKNGKTILLASHDLWDIEALCKRIIFINHGKILRDCLLENFLKQEVHERSIKLSGIPRADLLKHFKPSQLKAETDHILLQIDTKQTSMAQVLSTLSSLEGLDELSIEQPSIEDLVLKLYQSEKST